jgi:hypothetical protein
VANEVKIFARVRKFLEGLDLSSPDTDQSLTLNDQLELVVAQGAGPYDEIVRSGRAFEVHTQSAIAAVVAMPTTAAMLSLQNMEPDFGRSYLIDRVWALRIVTTTAIASQASLIGTIGQTRVAALGALSALPINALNGNAGKDTKAQSYLAAIALDAATGSLNNWAVLPGQTGGLKMSSGAATVGGDFINAEINGRRIVPPGHVFAVHVLAPLVAETFICGIEWREKKILLG